MSALELERVVWGFAEGLSQAKSARFCKSNCVTCASKCANGDVGKSKPTDGQPAGRPLSSSWGGVTPPNEKHINDFLDLQLAALSRDEFIPEQ